MADIKALDVWERLSTGSALDGLGLDSVGGRVDLRGLQLPGPGSGAVPSLRGVHWKGLDLSRARLGSIRFHDCVLEDCSFQGASCADWRLWGTTVLGVDFRGTDLRGAALGAISNGRRNAFRRVDFSGADLRKTVHISADMVDCRFEDARIVKVDFGANVFVDCVFAGTLEEVLFYRTAFGAEGCPPNEMSRVDFRRARFRFVEFRGLDMATVKWPEGDDHVLIDDYPATLDRVLSRLRASSDDASRRLSALLAMKRKWAGPSQRVGIVSKADLIEAGGPAAVAMLVELIAASARTGG